MQIIVTAVYIKGKR